MKHQDPPNLNSNVRPQADELARIRHEIERALQRNDFTQAARLIEQDLGSAWYGFPPHRTAEILRRVADNVELVQPQLAAAHKILTSSRADLSNTEALVEVLDADDHEHMFALAMFRMVDYRMHGRMVSALEQLESVEAHLAPMQTANQSRREWFLHAAIQIGITAMLAGDFTKALASFMRAQMLPTVPKFPFLEREAIVKSALIHACFGNAATADGLLKRTNGIRRSSSWCDTNIDTQEEFVRILTYSGDLEEAIDRLEAISLQDIGDMWPFYIVAFHRVLEAAGHHDELEHQLEMFDSLPFPRVDGEGFTGSVLPLKRAMVALIVGRGAEALKYFDRADPSLTYTKLVQSAVDLYVGRTQQAIDRARDLRKETRGFRLMEIRRRSVLAAAQYLSGELEATIETLKAVAELPRGLTPHEVLLFSDEIKRLAEEHVPNWPKTIAGNAIFLPDLPKPGHALTGREIEILELLSRGYTRAEIATELYISVSTVKTQLRSLYRKLEVSSASDAVFEGERRGVI